MTMPLVVLGVGALVAGYVWVGLAHFEPWVKWLEPALGSIGEHAHTPAVVYGALVAGGAACAVGMLTAYSFYFRGSETPARLQAAYPRLHALLMDKWRVDELYEATILGLSRLLARASAAFDKYIVDGIVTEVSSQLVLAFSYLTTRLQDGIVHTYGAVMCAGTLAVAFFFIVPHPEPIVGDPEGLKVKVDAERGVDYKYRWDFDGDGNYDTAWSEDPKAEHEYSEAELTRGVVAVFEGAAYGAEAQLTELSAGDALSFSKRDLGPTWQNDPRNDEMPTIVADKNGLVVHPNGARVYKNGELQLATAKVPVGFGEHVTVGEARVSVTGVVHPRLQVVNGFSMERTRRFDLVLPKVEARIVGTVAGVVGGAP